MHFRSAFTLIELLVVIALIAMLVGILLPSLYQARELTERSMCAANMHHISVGLHMYAARDVHGHFPPSPEWMNAADTMHLYSPDNWERDKHNFWPRGGRIGYNDPWIGLGLLFDARIADNPESFYCPGIKDSRCLTYPNGWRNLLAHENFLHGGYYYRLFGQPVVQTSPQITTRHIEHLWHLQPDADEAILSDVFLDIYDRGDPAHMLPYYGLNVTYTDGHTKFVTLGDDELARADDLLAAHYDRRDRFVWLYFYALGSGDFTILDYAGYPVPFMPKD